MKGNSIVPRAYNVRDNASSTCNILRKLKSTRDAVVQMRIPEVKHPVWMALFWKERDDTEASKALVSNRLTWEVIRMVVVYRHRWTGTETFHRDGKQELGLGDCQGRHGKGQTRHGYLVSAAYSLLMRSLHQTRPQAWARTRLTTIGEACRAIKGELLGQLVDWIIDKLAGLDHRVSHLVLMTTEKTPRLIPRGLASRELPRPPEP